MRKQAVLFLVLFFMLLIGITSCQPQDALPEDVTALNVTQTSTSMPIFTSVPTEQVEVLEPVEWEDRNLTGKIVYIDRTANQIVIMDADGENSKEISYIPGETYEPYLGSSIKWSHDGRKLAFGCQKLSDSPDWTFFPVGRGDDIRISLCILDLVENMQGQSNNISHGLHVIELPEYYMPLASEGAYSNSRRFASLAWLMKDEEIVLTPFCVVKVDESKTDCSNWDDLDRLGETNKMLLENAEFIAPSPVDPKKWALTINNQILIMDMAEGQVDYIDIEYKDILLYWSSDGKRIAILARELDYPYTTVVGVLDIRTSSFMKKIWVGEDTGFFEPGLITARSGPSSFVLRFNYPQQNIAWSAKGRYLVLNTYLFAPFSETYARIYAAMYYFDLERGEIFPARNGSDELGFPTEFRPEWNIDVVTIDEFKLFTSPDWYACDDAENVCELYK